MNKKLRKKFNFCDYLFLRYSLEEITNEMTVSNLLFHLFYCPRSIFAKNNCLRCSRLFVKKDLQKRFDFVEDFKFFSYFELEKFDDEIDKIISKFEFNVFFNNDHQQDVIQSNRKRCLNSFVVQEHIHFILLFLEIQLRIFSNFFILYQVFLQKEKKEKCFWILLLIL